MYKPHKQQITLSNRLLVPTELIPTRVLSNWHYEWREIVLEPKKDDLGDLILDANEKPELEKRWEQHSLRSYREIVSASGATLLSIPRGDMKKAYPILRKFPYRDLRPVTPLPEPIQMQAATTPDNGRHES